MIRRVAGLDGDPTTASTFLRLNFCVLRGMAIYDGMNRPEEDSEAVLDLWISLARQHLEGLAQASAKQGSVPGRAAWLAR